MAKEKRGTSGQSVRDVMTPDPACVSEKDSIREAARIMKDQDTGVVPVVDGRKVVGLVTDRDIVVRLVADGKNPGEATVRDAMSSSVRSVREDASVDEVLDLMANAEIRRVPVVNQSDELVGIVSIGDISTATNKDGEVGKAIEEISSARPNN